MATAQENTAPAHLIDEVTGHPSPVIGSPIGANGAVLFRTDDKAPLEKPAFPALAESSAVRSALPTMSADTREALAQARTPQDWNTFLLASPELMHR